MNQAVLSGTPKVRESWLLEMPFLDEQKVHGLQPQVHRDMAILENSANFHGELFAALVALVEANTGRFTLHLADALQTPAMGTNRAFRPYAGLNPRDSGGTNCKTLAEEDRIGHDTCFPLMI